MIVVLIGYMGVGKTTIGKKAADILGYDFIDLDDYISQNEKVSIAEIFKTKGEIYFRQKESKYLRDLLTTEKDFVLALGGGTPCYSNNMDVLKNAKDVTSFYLKLGINELSERLLTETDKRPLIAHLRSKEELTEFIGKHLFERTNYYNLADQVINCNSKTVDQISGAIVASLV